MRKILKILNSLESIKFNVNFVLKRGSVLTLAPT
jgi:hypothetical protein